MRRISLSGWGKKHRISLYPARQALALLLLLLPMVMVNGPAAAQMATVSLDFESQALDLETGIAVEIKPFDLRSVDGVDVYIAYNANRTPHAVVFTVGDGTEIAFMQGVAFEFVTLADIESLEFLIEPPDVPFTPSDTIVIRTSDGSVFKLGNAIETEEWVIFDYELLQ